MNIVLFSNGNDLGQIYAFFEEQNNVNGLVVPDTLHSQAAQLVFEIEHKGCPVYKINGSAENWTLLYLKLCQLNADVIITMGFPYKTPVDLTQLPKYGAYNVHFSLLPAYRGADPVFWQLKNGSRETGVTIHRMTAQMDGGAIALQHRVAVMPGETYGILHSRLNAITIQLLRSLLISIDNISGTEQDTSVGSYFPRPGDKDITIDWHVQTADEIECLVNACNPAYNGAITYLNGQEVRIMEVSPAQLPGNINGTPGNIVYADANYGLFVACKNGGFLRVNIVATNEGILSGIKLISLGVNTMHKFDAIIRK